jgi:hypothetical protein
VAGEVVVFVAQEAVAPAGVVLDCERRVSAGYSTIIFSRTILGPSSVVMGQL